jgi:predicted Ser/Thr protein kinase
VDDYKSIVVKEGNPVKVVHNPTDYPMIGRGANGAVFKLSEDRCVKIFPDKRNAQSEGEALTAGQRSRVFPRLYKTGRKYVVMEYISGSYLDEYLKKKGHISEQITEQILFVLKELKRLQFPRLDARLRHLVLTKGDQLKVIDHANSLSKHFARPVYLLAGLKKLGLRSAFLKQVKKQNPDLYKQWTTK